MLKFRVFLTGLTCLSLFAIPPCHGQDTTGILVLSPRVGAKISAGERSYFRLFPQFDDFVEAVVFATPGGAFHVRITREPEKGVFRDTVVEYGSHTLLMVAEKINHFEALSLGRYQIGDDPTAIRNTDGMVVLHSPRINRDSLALQLDTIERARIWHDQDPSEKVCTVGLSSGLALKKCLLENVDDSAVVLESDGGVTSVPVRSVDFLLRKEKTHFWAGAGIGLVAGAVLGAVVGYATYRKPQRDPNQWINFDFGPNANALGGAILGIPIGFVVGGVIGGSVSGDDIIDLSGASRETKLVVIRMVISGKQ